MPIKLVLQNEFDKNKQTKKVKMKDKKYFLKKDKTPSKIHNKEAKINDKKAIKMSNK